MTRQLRIAAFHDISCAGKCSLTVALPIISAAGIEVSVVPTAVLSTHTGGFSGYTYRDLSGDLIPIINHWQTLDLKIDALYSGFLGSAAQIDIMTRIFDALKTEDNLIIIDPVMADEGALYKVYDENYPQGMKKLCKKADIIVPNITEAALLTDMPYTQGPYKESYILDLLKGLKQFGAKIIVLTGVYFDERHLGVAVYDCEADKISYAFAQKIEGFYHGTGDVFASAFIAAYLKKKSLYKCGKIAVDFTVESILRTKKAGTDRRYGVNFEQGLKKLAKLLND